MIRTWRTAAAMLLASALLWPMPASAHDQFIGSDPADGSTLTTFPSAVNLEFNNTPLEIGATIVVVDTQEREYTTDVTFADHVVTAHLAPGPSDTNYQVRWRVVSSDGHAISGAFDFAVGDVSAADQFPPLEGSDAAASTTQAPAGSDSGTGVGRTALIAVAGALVALGLWAALARLRRPSRQEN